MAGVELRGTFCGPVAETATLIDNTVWPATQTGEVGRQRDPRIQPGLLRRRSLARGSYAYPDRLAWSSLDQHRGLDVFTRTALRDKVFVNFEFDIASHSSRRSRTAGLCVSTEKSGCHACLASWWMLSSYASLLALLQRLLPSRPSPLARWQPGLEARAMQVASILLRGFDGFGCRTREEKVAWPRVCQRSCSFPVSVRLSATGSFRMELGVWR